MKKLLVTIFLFVMALALVACGGNDNGKSEGIKDAASAKAVYDATIDAYKNATGVDCKYTYEDKDGTQNITFQYILEGDKVKELAYVVKNKSGELSVYVKDGVAYMNAYGTKSKANMTDADNANFKSAYGFEAAMVNVNSLFGVSFFTAATLDSVEGSVAKLSCDLNALAADPQLGEDEYFEMEENIEKLREKKALNVEVTFNGNAMTKFVGFVTEQDDSTKTFTVEFLGNAPTITYPDFASYEVAK